MSVFRLIYQQIKVDLLGHLRGYTLPIVLGLSIAATYLLVPDEDASYVSMSFDEYRPLYNSAGIGGLVTVLGSVYIIWFAFFVVRGAVNRDRETGVGQIIATTPLKKWQYLFGKWLSNAAIMLVIVLGLILASIVMQLMRGEVNSINIFQLGSPLLLILLPILLLVAAIALLFESIPEFRGFLGIVAYFLLFVTVLSTDSLGSAFISENIRNDLLEVAPGYSGNVSCCIQFKDPDSPATIWPLERLETFEWTGMDWTPDILLNRLALFALSIGLLIPSTMLFDRFSQSRRAFSWLDRLTSGRWQTMQDWMIDLQERIRRHRLIRWLFPIDDVNEQALELQSVAYSNMKLTPLELNTVRFRPISILMTEMRLMLKGRSVGWYLVMIGLFIASLLSPNDVVRSWLLPLSLLWPLLIWSSMGVREQRYHTEQYIFATPAPLRTQLPLTWVAGVIFTLMLISGGLLRFGLAGAWSNAYIMTVAALFIPTLALALGIWSGGQKAFESIYIVLWYGNMNRVSAFDFMGLEPEKAIQSGTPVVFLVLTLILAGLAIFRRKQQLQL